MGMYLHPGSMDFKMSINSEIYIDKTKLIAFTNKKINTQQRYVCVSRPRRFGKTMATGMLAAYYDCRKDTSALFDRLKIKEDTGFSKHLNRYNVLKLDMQSFMSNTASIEAMLVEIKQEIIKDLKQTYTKVYWSEEDTLWRIFSNISEETEMQFVILIDEWDCVMRRYRDEKSQKKYLDFLRNFIKDQPYIALAYMTGILPIKKYGEHSTLNMFYEYSMIDSAEISDCFGFTEEEVQGLCEKYGMNFKEVKEWYDGYHLISGMEKNRKEYSIYSPKSIVESMIRLEYGTYWNQTETYEALQEYIQLNMNGLKDSVVDMLGGAAIEIDPGSFRNDMIEFHSRDEVLTLLVHLGYLTYNRENKTVVIPNKEVSEEFIRSINHSTSYAEVAKLIKDSKKLLQALWNRDEEAVAEGVQLAHEQFPSIQYNSENALSCVIQLAFYYAREYYTIFRELPTGVGFADICLVPKPGYADKPAVIIELKWDKKVETAIQQIKERKYSSGLEAYRDNLLLCGITYDKEKDKTHKCVIEKAIKE